MRLIRHEKLIHSDEGKTAVEYAAILAIVTGICIGATELLGASARHSFWSAASGLNNLSGILPRKTVARAPRIISGRSIGLTPLNEMTAEDSYDGEDGGLYGGGLNRPPERLEVLAESQTARIQPLDANGDPAADGKIGLISIGMANATDEFRSFKQLANSDPEKASEVIVVDCAECGRGIAEWADPQARLWSDAQRRLELAHLSPQQVQAAWVKLANACPNGELAEHGIKLKEDAQAALRIAIAKFPNLRIAYLSSRIYGGYARDRLNPEPYAYEGAFAVRWLIQDQLKQPVALSPDTAAPSSPLLLWGPYLWADGTTPRATDGLVWTRNDLGADGVHPDKGGREKVARLLLDFFKTDDNASTWFLRGPAAD
jgi:Flp pilus assembly pilin Flp